MPLLMQSLEVSRQVKPYKLLIFHPQSNSEGPGSLWVFEELGS
jgi:hypothetical protein